MIPRLIVGRKLCAEFYAPMDRVQKIIRRKIKYTIFPALFLFLSCVYVRVRFPLPVWEHKGRIALRFTQ